MPPPGNVVWKMAPEAAHVFADARCVVFSGPREAEEFATKHWTASYTAGDALFLRSLPPLLGEPTSYTPSGLPAYRPTFPPDEVWYVPGVAFRPLWSFAKRLGFLTPTLPVNIVEACDNFLDDLGSREPVGLWRVGEGVAVFQRVGEGSKFVLADMRRASELNLAVLGGPQDAFHHPGKLAGNFVRQGLFYFGCKGRSGEQAVTAPVRE